MRRFNLNRLDDETGISGKGIVTEGYQFNSGICVMKWLTGTSSVAVYASIDDLVIIHGHNGKTVVEWDSEEINREDLPLWAQDPIGFFEAELTLDSHDGSN